MSALIHVIFVMALLMCVPFSSGAPADIGAFLSDVTGLKVEDTTQFVTELIETATESQPESSTYAAGVVQSIDAVTLEPAEPTTELDLEAVIIDLGVDRLAQKDAAIDAPALLAKDDIQTTTDVAQTDEISTEVPADPADAPPIAPMFQEKVEVAADDHQTTLSDEAPSTEAATSQPEAAGNVALKNQTKEAIQTVILADPEDVPVETTTSTQEKIELIAESDGADTIEKVALLEEASSTETATGRPEADSEMGIMLKADFKNPADERVEGTEVVTDGATIQPEFDVTEQTESVPVALKNDAESTDPTSFPLADELGTLSVNEDVTESAFQSTDSGTDVVDEIVRMEPQLVKIFDPSVDVEATTFLAEANLLTDAEGDATTEAFYHADVVDDNHIEEDEEEALTTTIESVGVTLEFRTESGTELTTESGTELTSHSDTTALPVNAKLSTPGGPALATKKRSYKGYKVYRVILPTEDSVRRILSMEDEPGVEFWADPRLLLRPRGLFVTSAADVMVAPQIVPEIESVFRQARLTYTVLIDDVHMSIAKENPAGPSFARSQTGSSGQHRLTWDRYHRLSDINSYLEYLKEAHPDWIEVMPIGKSSQGRPIHVIKLSRSRQPDGVETGQKKAILVDAGMHANEWITPAALTWMINELVENADSYNCILDRFDWYFVPMVNPDGYEYSHVVDRMWRKTRRNYTSTLVRTSARKLRVDADDEQCVGADINRNFEFHWRKGGSSSNVCSPSFAGVKPFSEPESRALANFMLKQRSRLAMYISLHSYSQMWLLPWGFAEARPEDFSELYSLAKIGARALQRTHNTSYLIGNWAKGVAGVRYSYTLEMRDAGVRGMILPAQQIVPTAEETWAGIYAASVELAHRLYQHLPSCSCFLVSICLTVVSSAPTADHAIVVRSTTETAPTTTEELDFKDVPIYEKEKLRKPPPGFKYVPVLKCSKDETEKAAPTPSNDQVIGDQEKIARPLETADHPIRPSVDEERQVTDPADVEDSQTELPVDAIIIENVDKSIVTTDVNAVDDVTEETNVQSTDTLTVEEEPIKIAQLNEDNSPIIASSSLEKEGESTLVAEVKPESENANAAVNDVKVNAIEANVPTAEELPSDVDDKNAVVSKEPEPVPQSQVVVDNVDVVASVDLDSVTEKSDAIDEHFETNGATYLNEDLVKDFTGYKVYRVTISTEEAARWILKFEDVPGIEFWSDAKLLLQPRGIFVTSATDILVAPDVVGHMEESLRQARLPFEILINDVQEAIRNENPPKSENEEDLMSRNGHTLTWERYHSLEDIDSYLEYLKLTFPNFVTVTEIGRTTEGRPIKAVRFHQEGGRSDKKTILIDAGIHAREWITPATITYMMREIVENPQQYDCIMNQFDWLFVPVLNPDGYAYTHSHNRIPKASLSCTGADANRNFDYHWLTGGSSRNPCSDTFAGAKPFSEPESRALRDLVLDNKDHLAMYISLHAYSQMWLIPWGHKQEKPEDFSDLYSLAKTGSNALESVNGVNYLIGSIPDLLYVASGSSIDWVKGAVGVKYTYTLELRDSGRFGFLLPARQIVPSGKETWVAIHASAVELAKRTYGDDVQCPEPTI
ncbi:hypothetical protein GHT06_019210 [Daphnia sinensis]|uniref:Peptidase M14 domain-containing protein n=1 Tax=Daphnia sinensis TaxID=1820382 RepID=A0AAD5KJS4_9CRUS|nr:hypothetical protein GHT06_019210 [Daphnia sinensis]